MAAFSEEFACCIEHNKPGRAFDFPDDDFIDAVKGQWMPEGICPICDPETHKRVFLALGLPWNDN